MICSSSLYLACGPNFCCPAVTEDMTVPSDDTQVFAVGCELRWYELRDGRAVEPLVVPRKRRARSVVSGSLSIGRQAQMIPVLASIRVHVDRGMKLPDVSISQAGPEGRRAKMGTLE